MTAGVGTSRAKAQSSKSDAELISECTRGQEAAWVELIAKYKNLIYSIPIRGGFSQEEAGDIFQAVCINLFCELSSLREPNALAGWLIRVTRNQCYHRRRENHRHMRNCDVATELVGNVADIPDNVIQEVEREQAVRNALNGLSPRCRQLLEKLFFDLPARPYQEVARELGLSVGSIGLVRRRCLNCLRGRLEELGLR